MVRGLLFLLLVSTAIVFLCEATVGQTPEQRYQLGRRLTRFERLWQRSDEASRARSTPKMQSAVNSFFRLQLDSAMSTLDEAWLALQFRDGPKAAEAAYDAGWFLRVSPLVVDHESVRLTLSLERQPKPSVAIPNESRKDVTVFLVDSNKKQIHQKTWQTDTPSNGWTWELGDLPEGDFKIEARISHNGESTDLLANGISAIMDRAPRIERVQTRSVPTRPAATDTKSLSILALGKQILNGAEG
jgi:hypothetical protein